MAEKSGFVTQDGEIFSPYHSVQNCPGAHTAPNQVGTGGPFPVIMCLEREAEYKYMYVAPFSVAFERKFCIRFFFTPCAPITSLTVFSLITRTLHPTKFPSVCHRPELIAVFTTTFCCTMSRARRRQLKNSHPISVRFILILSSFQRLEPPANLNSFLISSMCVTWPLPTSLIWIWLSQYREKLRRCALFFLVTHVITHVA
jgi:hypothetical protein